MDTCSHIKDWGQVEIRTNTCNLIKAWGQTRVLTDEGENRVEAAGRPDKH